MKTVKIKKKKTSNCVIHTTTNINHEGQSTVCEYLLPVRWLHWNLCNYVLQHNRIIYHCSADDNNERDIFMGKLRRDRVGGVDWQRMRHWGGLHAAESSHGRSAQKPTPHRIIGTGYKSNEYLNGQRFQMYLCKISEKYVCPCKTRE